MTDNAMFRKVTHQLLLSLTRNMRGYIIMFKETSTLLVFWNDNTMQHVFIAYCSYGVVKQLAIENLFDEDDEETESDVDTDSQFAVLKVKIYRAEGLSSLNRGLLAHIKKRCTVDDGVFVDPYVQVFFAGLKGFTSKKKRTICPVWEEEVVFTTKFPLPPEPIIIQVRDDDFVGNNDIGTVVIPLDKISSSDEQGPPCCNGVATVNGSLCIIRFCGGFLPTLGPCYVYLRDQKQFVSEDTSCSGRLLMAITMDIVEGSVYTKTSVQVEPTPSAPQGTFSYDSEFFLFACVQDASMIDRRLVEMKEMRFSLQMGAEGRQTMDAAFDDHNATPFMEPEPMDKQYLYLPLEGNKPCMWLKAMWPDERRRMYISNILSKMERKIVLPKNSERIFRHVLLQNTVGSGESSNEEVLHVSAAARTTLNKNTLEGTIDKLSHLRSKMESLEDDPQSIVPDVVVWLESGSKRVGCAKVQARDLLYAVREYERGSQSGKTLTLFLKPLGRREEEMLLAKVECYLWFGPAKQMDYCFRDLPQGFNMEYAFEAPNDTGGVPKALHYLEKHVFQLRAHIYQARSLPSRDRSRYPNCCAMVIFKNHIRSTQVRENSLNPIWDEMLLFPEIEFYGDARFTPVIVVEVHNFGVTGKSGFLGRVITSIEMNKNSENALFLQWYDIQGPSESNAQLLAAFELHSVEESTDMPRGDGDADLISVRPIPFEIRPRFAMHRIEILLWGLREMRRSHWRHIDRPRIDVECAGHLLHSSVIFNYRQHSNFAKTVEHLDLELPDQEDYLPPLILKLIDTKSFGRQNVIATHILTHLQEYVFRPQRGMGDENSFSRVSHIVLDVEHAESDEYLDAFLIETVKFLWTRVDERDKEEEEEETMDWWSRYYLSTGENPQVDETFCSIGPDTVVIPRSSLPSAIFKISEDLNGVETDTAGFVVYSTELENVPEFGGFQEWLHSFELTKGRKITRNPLREKIMAVLKGCFRIYRTPLPPDALDPLLPLGKDSEGLFGGLPKNKPTKILARAYIVKAINLEPSKVTNTTDPYIVLQLGKHRLSDKENYISKQLNPVFSKCFEFVANFPMNSLLRIQLFDWNLVGADELIGETVIDLENRYYSRHRATCGLARFYETTGPNAWRDALKPSEILQGMCRESRLDGPHTEDRSVRIGKVIIIIRTKPFSCSSDDHENMALALLHRWKDISPSKYPLVPEHVETRILYNPKKPLEPQGQLVMWLDMFAEDTVPPAMPRDISMRKPESYELRVIIWNTDEVILADDAFFTGEKMSDIYVKGWLTGKEDAQMTDVHYRSLTGEGNFNWRFVFPFDYLSIERKVVIKRKVSVFSWDETEFKLPPLLELQVWDADHFSADDHLGTISLDLNRFPRGARSASLCTLDMLRKDGTVPQVSIFKQTCVKGWWPVTSRKNRGETKLTGKIEAEIQLLTREEAEKTPAGRGRKGPDPLEEPKRPETSFINILNPLKTLRYAVWKNYKFMIIKCLILIALALIFALFFYSFPGYMAKKMLRA
ncbi:otoferlin-like [Argiope bruennichi]|uniref:otoferlin-like n=1 Tax=Argiope bruennichi TaxID=94029 RepID=UPI0024941B70|nr:otoferlin-like [Argiope bruennichi]